MSYPETVHYLYSLGNELKTGAGFGLETMRRLLQKLGNPEREQRLVHVAGTNGKGSTAAMIAAACRASGLRTGLYTSPHLIAPTERIQVDGQPVTPGEFDHLFQEVHTVAEKLLRAGELSTHPSYFETVTAMGLLHFSRQTDFSVIEVGLGGRLDATNTILPALCVITPVDFDHETYLGNTLAKIAAEKAGILKPGVPAVFGRQREAGLRVLMQRATELKCPVHTWADDQFTMQRVTARESEFVFSGREWHCPLPGRHQVDNALTAILACMTLGIAVDNIQAGLAAVQWPGRLEYISEEPCIVLDGAHNPSGARALAGYIREFCRDRPVWIVYGTMRDKALDEVVEHLFPRADCLILTAADMPRALRPEAIREASGHSNALIAPTLPEALAQIRAAPRDAIVFITGSLFVVGEARGLLVAQPRSTSFVQ